MGERELAQVGAGLSMIVDFEAVKHRISQLQKFIKDYMVKGVDYGTIPGTDKLTLLKPGAEKLCDVYCLAAGEAKIDFIRDDTKSPIYIHYRVSLPLISRADGKVIMVGVGSANSYEKKYRWRWVSDKNVPSMYDKNNLNFKDNNGQYGPYKTYRIPNDEVDDIDNTLLKMAKKRALVDAVLSATRSSALFTQDAEDLPDMFGPDGANTSLDDHQVKPDRQSRSTSAPRQPTQEKGTHNNNGGATENQVNAIHNMASRKNLSEEDLTLFIKEEIGKESITNLSKQEASKIISALQNHDSREAS